MKDKADDIRELEKWRKACYERDDGRCQITGKPAEDVHHIIKRSHGEFKTDPDNGILLTREIHEWVEANPVLGMKTIKAVIGSRYELLRAKFQQAYGYDYFSKYEDSVGGT